MRRCHHSNIISYWIRSISTNSARKYNFGNLMQYDAFRALVDRLNTDNVWAGFHFISLKSCSRTSELINVWPWAVFFLLLSLLLLVSWNTVQAMRTTIWIANYNVPMNGFMCMPLSITVFHSRAEDLLKENISASIVWCHRLDTRRWSYFVFAVFWYERACVCAWIVRLFDRN